MEKRGGGRWGEGEQTKEGGEGWLQEKMKLGE